MGSPVEKNSVTIDGLAMDSLGNYETDNATYVVNSYVYDQTRCGTIHYLTIQPKKTTAIVITGKAYSTTVSAWQPRVTTSGWKIKLP